MQSFTENDPTVPAHVKSITQANIDTWNNKQATITGAASSITSSNLTANMALRTDDNGKITNSSATSTELSYLSGVTSAVQTQLDGKQAKGSYANTDLSNVTNVSSVFKENSAGWNIPNYAAGVGISSGAIMSNSGLILVLGYIGDHVWKWLKINNAQVFNFETAGAYLSGSDAMTFQVAKNDKVEFSNCTVTFFPHR